MEKSLSLLPTFRIQKTFNKNHPLSENFKSFYSFVGRKKYLIKKEENLTIKRVPYESLDLGGLSTSSRWVFASGEIKQKNGTSSIDLVIQPQEFIRKTFNIILGIIIFFVILTALTAKPMGAFMLFLLLLFLTMPWYLMLKSGIKEFKEELEKDIELFK